LALEKRADFARGVGGDFHQTLVTNPEIGASRSSSLQFSHHCAVSLRVRAGWVNLRNTRDVAQVSRPASSPDF
jgi:hypothetical protein